MTRKRYFYYEVYWAGEYNIFNYLKDARRFLRNKSKYTIYKCWYDKNGDFSRYEVIEESI